LTSIGFALYNIGAKLGFALAQKQTTLKNQKLAKNRLVEKIKVRAQKQNPAKAVYLAGF